MLKFYKTLWFEITVVRTQMRLLHPRDYTGKVAGVLDMSILLLTGTIPVVLACYLGVVAFAFFKVVV